MEEHDWQRYCFNLREVTYKNRADLLVAGREVFPAMLAAIESAKRTVWLETYIYEDDATGERFAAALIAAAARGVACCFLMDAIGAALVPSALTRQLRHAGVKVRRFRPISARAPLGAAFLRDHRKVLVVDGAIAFVGGLNIHDEAAAVEDGGQGWHDFAVRIEGPAARRVAKTFRETWRLTIRPGERSKLPEPHRPPAAGEVPLRIIATDAVRGRWPIRRELIGAIKQARREVLMAHAYFVPDRGVIKALAQAKKRGVSVKLLLPKRSDIVLVDYASSKAQGELLARGVNVVHYTESVLHAKVAVVDRVWSMVGSYNLDWMSLLRNREIVCAVYDERFGQKIAEQLAADMSASEPLSLGAWKGRPLWKRYLAEPVAYSFRRYL